MIAENLNNEDEQTLSTAPYQSLTMDTSTWEAGNHIIELHVQEEYPMLGGEAGPTIKSYPIFADVYIETSNRLAFAEMLVSNIVDEASVTVTNLRYTGLMAASTNITNGFDHGIHIDEGIIMTTGSARLWNAGKFFVDTDEEDDDSITGDDEGELPGDDLISKHLGNIATFDAAVLEFDVILNTNTQFECEYQLGSEEFLDYVAYANDTPLITIEGIYTSLLPDLSDIIAINTFHPEGTNDWGTPYPSTNEYLYISTDELVPSQGFDKAEYDGISVPLKSITLTKQQSFHFRYSITDVIDDDFDSALITAQGSVRSLGSE